MAPTSFLPLPVALAWRRLRVCALALYLRRRYHRTESRAARARDPDRRTAIWDAEHEQLAPFVCRQAMQLGGLWVKLGQFLSTRTDVMPEAWLQELKNLQDAMPPRPSTEVRRALSEALGDLAPECDKHQLGWCPVRCRRRQRAARGPSAKLDVHVPQSEPTPLFTSFEWRPMASASIAQVHRAVLADGRQVAMKIRHCDVAEVIDLDMKLLAELAERAAKERPKFDFRKVLNEWCMETRKELDFVNEAMNLRRVARALREVPGTPVCAPRVVRQPQALRPSPRLLVLEYIDGVKPVAAKSIGADPQRIFAELSSSLARQIFITGLFHADPHPGNILIERGSRKPVLLDFGLTKELPLAIRLTFAQIVVAVIDSDLVGLLAALRDMGLEDVAPGGTERAMATVQQLFKGPIYPCSQLAGTWPQEVVIPSAAAPAGVDPGAAVELGTDETLWAEEDQEDAEMVTVNAQPSDDRNAETAKPPEAVAGSAAFLLRVTYCLRGLAFALGVEHRCLEAMYPFAQEALRHAAQRRCADAALRASPLSLRHSNGSVVPLQEKLSRLLWSLTASGEALGIAACVYRDGTLAANCAAGERSLVCTERVQEDTCFAAFDCGDALITILLHTLVDAGQLDLDRTVGSYWPEFGCLRKEILTVRDVLERRSGLAKFAGMERGTAIAPMEELCQWTLMLRRLAAAKFTEPPRGAAVRHGLSFGWLAGGLAERAAGETEPSGNLPLPVLLNEKLLEPLGLLGHAHFMLPPRGAKAAGLVPAEDRLAPVGLELGAVPSRIWRGCGSPSLDPRAANEPRVRRALCPGLSAQATAQVLAGAFAALAATGTGPAKSGASVGATRILSVAYADQLLTDMRASDGGSFSGGTGSPAVDDCDPKAKVDIEETWPCGFQRIPFRRADGSVRKSAFGQVGLGGSLVLCEPAVGVAVAVLVSELATAPRGASAVLRLLAEEIPDLGECFLERVDKEKP